MQLNGLINDTFEDICKFFDDVTNGMINVLDMSGAFNKVAPVPIPVDQNVKVNPATFSLDRN